MGSLIQLKNVRISFPVLFTPKRFKDQDTSPLRFGATFLIELGSVNDRTVRNAIREVSGTFDKKNGVKGVDVVKQWETNKNKYCYTEGVPNDPNTDGMMLLSTTSATRPEVRNRDRTPLAEEDGVIYAGCTVNAFVDIWAQDKNYPGIRGGLKGVQFVQDGEAFSGSAPLPDDAFADLSVDSDGEDGEEDLFGDGGGVVLSGEVLSD